jgi:chemotaxis protein CheZ
MPTADPTAVPETDRRQTAEPRDAHEYASAEAIRDAVEEMLATLRGDFSAGHVRISGQLRDLAGYIDSTRQELARLRPGKAAERGLANATDELDAVVQETEDATNTIMQAAEEIEAAAAAHSAPVRGLSAAVTKIYEACSFQDLTGQRIRRVVRALKEIESKVDGMIAALDGGKPAPGEPGKARDVAADARLVNGPQAPAEAISQDDVDSMLADMD